MFSDHTGMKLIINNRTELGKHTHMETKQHTPKSGGWGGGGVVVQEKAKGKLGNAFMINDIYLWNAAVAVFSRVDRPFSIPTSRV